MTVALIGLGLIGGSFARDLRTSGLTAELLGVDADPAHAARALELGLVDRIVALGEAAREADALLLAVPVNAIETLLPSLLDTARDGQTVIDLGSTKLRIADAVREHPRRERYVAAHPMAGTENAGPDAAMEGLFRNKTVLLCDLEWSAPDACKTALELFHAVGLKFEFMTAEQHDRHAAYVSHLSHVVAYALSLAVQSEEKAGYAVPRLAGGGFASTVRLAKSSPDMWVPIFEQNRDAILAAVAAFSDRVAAFTRCLEERDWDRLDAYIREANRIRDLL
ncbi:MAG TPA: prephenate dehydrogenase [Kiritimatiellia bacterium]|jgi:prephenate dehydrogenase|nr:MAG: prephenate dehydrogenase [Verrucomicrobia bacterium ADurb.Bin070]HQL50303.1 prephenate dehydrogenase [Kiritimatiellia bacterium]